VVQSPSSPLPRIIVGVVIAFVLALLAIVQFASDAIYGSVAQPESLPSRLPFAIGVRIYEIVDRVAPAPYVEATLAGVALSRGDLFRAEHYAVRLPASAMRDELLARIALARGEDQLATEYFFVAADDRAMQAQIAKLARRDAPAALDLAQRFRRRLAALGTHPDAIAESYFQSGVIAASIYDGADALRYYESAASLAPLDLKYVLSAANQALVNGDLATARRYYRAGRNAAPGSAEFVAGLGLVALHSGDRARAQHDLARARAMNPQAALVRTLEHELQ
jgi:tetratricopeptide (TPR) repeat protein